MKGILFKPDMIKAIVDRRITQTRRVIKPQPEILEFNGGVWLGWVGDHTHGYLPRYQVGETVYIKEAWWFRAGRPNSVIYRDGVQKFQTGEFNPNRKNVDGLKFKSPLFMKADFARYFIKIKDVRAERLQRISSYDVEREGCPFGVSRVEIAIEVYDAELALEWFRNTWDTINKPPYDWASNPWVFVYEFEFIPHQDKL